MKNFQIYNIVIYDGDVYYVSEIHGKYFVTITKNSTNITTCVDLDKIKDIELSDWLFDKLFSKLNERQWLIDTDSDRPFYDYILQKKSGLYMILSGDKCSLPCFSIREFQNTYSLYREHESCERLKTDIDIKLLEIFNLL